MVKAETVENREQFVRVAQFLAQDAGAPIGVTGRPRGEAICCDVAAAQGELDRKLATQPLLRARQAGKPIQRSPKVGQSLGERRTGKCTAPGLLVVHDSL